jgi:glycerol-3-phosphate acyltransferase PlsY
MSYLIGALPFSLWIAKWRGVEIQMVGSGNPGATNVARSVGKEWGALALVLDIGKGAVAGLLLAELNAPLALAGFAVLGHNWSPFLKFKGGKGGATTLGVLIAVNWLAAVWTIAVWLVLVLITRKVSIGSIIALLASPVVLWLIQADWTLILMFAALGVLSVIRHRDWFAC